jgi:hypothetical protein
MGNIKYYLSLTNKKGLLTYYTYDMIGGFVFLSVVFVFLFLFFCMTLINYDKAMYDDCTSVH